MKSININIKNIKSLAGIVEGCSKKIRQWRYHLPVINLALFMGIIILAIICLYLVYNPPKYSDKLETHEESELKTKPLPPITEAPRPLDSYELIQSNNPFSPNRTAWNPPEPKKTVKPVVKHEDGGAGEIDEETGLPTESIQKPRGTPKKITLQGILILGKTKKALIENPDQSKGGKQFIYIEEGEEVGEYKVKNIEPDQVRLDWYGEEQIIVMRSNINK